MKTVVFAYHNIGIIGLEALVENGYAVRLVITHIDNPNENRWYGSVAEWCQRAGIPCRAVADVNAPEIVQQITDLKPDVLFSFYCRTLLEPAILMIPSKGAYNLHGSLLPKYRGCAPVNWVLIKGEEETGVTLHKMVARADAGDIMAQARVWIASDDTALSLYGKIESAARDLLARALPRLRDGRLSAVPQDMSRGSYCRRRTPEDGHIDWHKPARCIFNLVRAVTRPYPGAFTYLGSEKLIIWWASVDRTARLVPGRIKCDKKVYVGTGEGALVLHEVECEGRTLTGDRIGQFMSKKESYFELA